LKSKSNETTVAKIKKIVQDMESTIHDLSVYYHISIPKMSHQPLKSKAPAVLESKEAFKFYWKESESNLKNIFLEIPKENLDFIFEEMKNDETYPSEIHAEETYSEVIKKSDHSMRVVMKDAIWEY